MEELRSQTEDSKAIQISHSRKLLPPLSWRNTQEEVKPRSADGIWDRDGHIQWEAETMEEDAATARKYPLKEREGEIP